MNLFERAARLIDALNDFFLRVAGWLGLVLVLLTTQQVIFRYLFKESSGALQEFEWHLFGAMFLLATPAVLRRNEHVRVDIFYSRLSKRAQAMIDVAGTVLFLIPTVLVLWFFGVDFVREAMAFDNPRPPDYYTRELFAEGGTAHSFFQSIEGWIRKTILVGEISPDAGGLEGRWLMKAMIPLSAFLLGLQALASLTRKLPVCFGRKGAE